MLERSRPTITAVNFIFIFMRLISFRKGCFFKLINCSGIFKKVLIDVKGNGAIVPGVGDCGGWIAYGSVRYADKNKKASSFLEAFVVESSCGKSNLIDDFEAILHASKDMM